MKRLITALCLTTMLLTACSSETVFLKPYSTVTQEESANAGAMIDADRFVTFAEDLGIVSKEEAIKGIYPNNGESSNTDALKDLEASEVLLVGTTDNEVLAAYNIYKQMPPASITKILTALVTLKSGADLEKTITLTDDVYIPIPDAQVCGFSAGDQIKLKDLLFVMLIYSGNDAANAIASYVGEGSISEFCKMMTDEAASLGASQTHFVTPNGLDDPEHYTSAFDLYVIFKECLKYDVFKDAISRSDYTITYKHNGEETTHTWPSTCWYLLGYENAPEGISVVGGKTGTTDNAGLCLILYSENKKGDGYISVLLGCPDKQTLYNSMSKLLSNAGK